MVIKVSRNAKPMPYRPPCIEYESDLDEVVFGCFRAPRGMSRKGATEAIEKVWQKCPSRTQSSKFINSLLTLGFVQVSSQVEVTFDLGLD
jgi:hypothetical protein